MIKKKVRNDKKKGSQNEQKCTYYMIFKQMKKKNDAQQLILYNLSCRTQNATNFYATHRACEKILSTIELHTLYVLHSVSYEEIKSS